MFTGGLTFKERMAVGVGAVMTAIIAATILAVLGAVMAKDSLKTSTESVCDTE